MQDEGCKMQDSLLLASYTNCVGYGHFADGKPPRGEPLAAWPSGSISEAPFGG